MTGMFSKLMDSDSKKVKNQKNKKRIAIAKVIYSDLLFANALREEKTPKSMRRIILKTATRIVEL